MENNIIITGAAQRLGLHCALTLQQAGYQTALIGKWHLGRGESGPLEQGFDVAVEFVHVAHSTLEGFDFVAQGLNGAGLGLQSAVHGLDLLEQVVAAGGDLFGGFTGHALDHGFRFFHGFVDALLNEALRFGLFACFVHVTLHACKALEVALDVIFGSAVLNA